MVKFSYRWVIIFFILGLAVVGAKVVSHWTIFPIKKVAIKGDYSLADQQYLQQLLLPYVNKGFFAVSVSAIKQKLDHEDWIRSSHVARNWPDELVITVQQRQAMARWNKTALIAQNNEVFHYHGKENINEQLPLLAGADEQRGLIVAAYLQLQTLLQTTDLTMSELYLDKQDIWHITFTNGMRVIMQKDQSIESLKKFIQVYQQKFYRNADVIDYVDLRYDSGFALRWKKHL